MDGIDTEWQAKSRTLGFSGILQQIKKGDGGAPVKKKKRYVPLANCGVPKILIRCCDDVLSSVLSL